MSYLNSRWTPGRPGLIPVFFLSAFLGISGQEMNVGSQSHALGGSFVTLSPGGGLLLNEAMLGEQKQLTCAFQHHRPFVTKTLGFSSARITVPVFKGAFSLGSGQFGIPGFRQFTQQLGYGLRISGRMLTGIGFSYSAIATQARWHELWQVGISGGVLYLLDELTIMGIHVRDPLTVSNYPEYGEAPGTSLALGIQRVIYSHTSWFLESEYQLRYGWKVKTALELTLMDRLDIRAGYHTRPDTFTFGSGFRFSRFTIDMGFSWTLSLGITPSILFTWQPDTK